MLRKHNLYTLAPYGLYGNITEKIRSYKKEYEVKPAESRISDPISVVAAFSIRNRLEQRKYHKYACLAVQLIGLKHKLILNIL